MLSSVTEVLSQGFCWRGFSDWPVFSVGAGGFLMRVLVRVGRVLEGRGGRPVDFVMGWMMKDRFAAMAGFRPRKLCREVVVPK